MDPFSAVLDGPRAREAFLLKTVLAPPWSIRVEDEAPLTVIALTQGRAWLVDGDHRLELAPGDLALVCGAAPYLFADAPDTPAQVRIDADQRCWALEDGRSLVDEFHRGVRTWGNTPHPDHAPAVALVGAYDIRSQITPLLLGQLPRFVHLPAAEWTSPIRDHLAHEIDRDIPGQAVMLDRILDLLLVEALRHWFLTEGEGTPAWWGAADDPLVGPALLLMQEEPARAWTVASLARAVGSSRAVLARRFTEAVGVPPMTFLTQIRLSLAADLLRTGTPTLAAVAEQVGYGSPYAFSTAFARAYGVSPGSWRRQLTHSG